MADTPKKVNIVTLDDTALRHLRGLDAEIELYGRGNQELIFWMELKIPMSRKTYEKLLPKLHIQYDVPTIT